MLAEVVVFWSQCHVSTVQQLKLADSFRLEEGQSIILILHWPW